MDFVLLRNKEASSQNLVFRHTISTKHGMIRNDTKWYSLTTLARKEDKMKFVVFNYRSLPSCVMSAYLYYVWLIALCRFNCIISVCLPVSCLPTCTMSAQLYDVCQPLRYLPTLTMSAYLYDLYYVCPTVHIISPPTCMISSRILSAYLYIYVPLHI